MGGSLKALLSFSASEDGLFSNSRILKLNNLKGDAIKGSLSCAKILGDKFSKGLLFELFNPLRSTGSTPHLFHREPLEDWN
jgi:hypothetical protein